MMGLLPYWMVISEIPVVNSVVLRALYLHSAEKKKKNLKRKKPLKKGKK